MKYQLFLCNTGLGIYTLVFGTGEKWVENMYIKSKRIKDFCFPSTVLPREFEEKINAFLA